MPSCHKVLVAHQTSTEVWAVDAHLHTLGSSVRLSSPATNLIYDPSTDKVLAVMDGSGQVAVIDPWTMTVTAYWGISPQSHLTSIGLDSALGVIFCGDESGNLTVADAQSGSVTGTVPTGAPITGITYDGAAQQIYCVSHDEGQVDVVQLAKGGTTLNLGQVSTVPGVESAAVIRGSSATQLWISYADSHGSYLQCYTLLF